MNSKKPVAKAADFSFGVKEPRQALRATEPLSVSGDKLQTKPDERSFDPYNTSGSFDRKKNWMRVGKR